MNKDVIDFLVKAKKATFAGEGARAEPSRPNSKDLHYVEGKLKYIDTYLGMTNFAGEEALWENDIPFWSMNYMGRVLSEDISVELLWRFLNEALLLVPKEYPYRGPLHYDNGDFAYRCAVNGDFHWFSGVEEIFYKGNKVYELLFHGGNVE
ncbi:MAG: DUF5680 domain-containing protein [Defluviitaleaceae bacterium]|nr:DUF5680 domain-containing protein [Defluviitaleaceae bacterium]